jgi:chitin disaccharide deacetylase
MKRLIVNADDFGLTAGVNRGIVEGHRRGIVTSATLMANGAAFEEAADLARENPRMGVGCHLVLVGGICVARRSDIPLLTDSDGNLPADLPRLVANLAVGKKIVPQLAAEFRAQVARILGAGIAPTHLDTHKHTHCHPRVMEALAEVAGEFGIRCVRKPFEEVADSLGLAQSHHGLPFKQRLVALAARGGKPAFDRLVRRHELRTPMRFYGVSLTGRLCPAAVLAMAEKLGEGTSELMCHPGYSDGELKDTGTRLREERELELQALVDAEVRNAIPRLGIQLVSYRELE